LSRTEGSKKMSLTVKCLISEAALGEPNKPRRALAVELQDRIKRMGEVIPSEETIQRKISEIRNHEPSPLDQPWCVGCLSKYPIPPEALPVVMDMYESSLNMDARFTIRVALWVARLYKLVDDDGNFLMRLAFLYAEREHIYWILDMPIDTRDIDRYTIACGDEEMREEIANSAWLMSPQEDIKELLKKKGHSLEEISRQY
jgi:hypothetical protein